MHRDEFYGSQHAIVRCSSLLLTNTEHGKSIGGAQKSEMEVGEAVVQRGRGVAWRAEIGCVLFGKSLPAAPSSNEQILSGNKSELSLGWNENENKNAKKKGVQNVGEKGGRIPWQSELLPTNFTLLLFWEF